MRRLVLFILSILSIAVVVESRTVAQDRQTLYFYSEDAEAFLLRDFDEISESVLTSYQLLQDSSLFNVIMGPGWSSSQDIFSWYSGDPRSGGINNSQAFIVDKQGDSIEHPLSECSTNLLDWASTTDLLLVGCYESGEFANYAYHILDANSSDLLVTVDKDSLGTNTELSISSYAEWTPSGNYIAVYFISRVEDDDITHTMRLYDLDGNIVRDYDFWTKTLANSRPQWSTEDVVAYIDSSGNALNIANVSEDTHFAIEIPFEQFGRIDWSLDGQYGLIYEGQIAEYEDDADYMNPVWLLDVPKRSVTKIVENARPPIFSVYGGRFNEQVWAEGKNQAFIVVTNSSVHVVKALNGEINLLHQPSNALQSISPYDVRWTQNAVKLALVEWAATTDASNQLFLYDVQDSDVIEQMSIGQSGNHSFELSPSGDLFVYYSQECGGVCILNLQSNETRNILIQTPGNADPAPPIYFSWHRNSNWVTALGIPDAGFQDIVIIDITMGDGEYIGRCSPYRSCFGWLDNSANQF